MPETTVIPFQPKLPQILPTIEGNVDYRDFREQLLLIDQLLVTSGLEDQALEQDLQRAAQQGITLSAKAQQNRQLHCRRALRCNMARILMKEDYRGFATRLADSPLLQHFCGISELGVIKVPAKSTLQRYDDWWPEAEVRRLMHDLMGRGASDPERLHLPEAIDLETLFVDTTCLPVNIHYPVDWVLLRDATRSLMTSVGLIREKGLKHRMEEPQTFISRINSLSIQMTHALNKADSQRQRKRIFRQMDRLVSTVRQHAQRYRDLLDQRWAQTEWTRPEAEQVLGRMDQVLEQLPAAREQARQRILKGQQVANKEKILSLYEPDVNVIVRKKAGAEVEFGNTLLLAENPQGLILEWELFRQSAPSDDQLLPRTVGRMEQAYGPTLKAMAGDRGFDSYTNREGLDADGIYNAVCPRNPRQLEERNAEPKFKAMQRRRAQTEGRVGIVKNVFLGGRILRKGFDHRQLTVTWTVLVHNLWVMARMQQKAIKEAQAEAA
jgi:hypothetical protein